MNIDVQSKCEACNRKEPVGRSKQSGRMVHSLYSQIGQAMRGEFIVCRNFDTELRNIAEPLGFYRFAWLPVRCRNDRLRWLTWIEDHGDSTFTLGNRAH